MDQIFMDSFVIGNNIELQRARPERLPGESIDFKHTSSKQAMNRIKLEKDHQSSVDVSAQSPLRMMRDAKLDKLSQMKMSK